ncbi:PhzF family phenazine biosynthesis protein [Rhizobium sp. Leaf341]|uniref:PhzF family phenazine biosynthesis protein n=1 Tax=Rhizobium sp. Leaf341 TaxID=1736344 RepID=UPI0007143BC6|nr:PhzF family phenazine biosynthesis protein [Rhizobium sp. Leaf341]KQR68938.1 phenazine biosynthesis protein PhzF [Rhizobium sp. Leaf341]
MARRYAIYDVFTREKLQGNPLAVVFDGDGLSTETMQAIAGEFNLSETVFVCAADNPASAARLRIFTPGTELPFAGHPTVGAAVALAEDAQGGEGVNRDLVHVLEENVGPVRCAVKLRPGEASFAEFDLPRKSVRLEARFDVGRIADALSLKTTQIGFENHVPAFWSAGVPFVAIPLHDLKAMADVDFDAAQWEQMAPMADGRLASAYLYCRGGINHHARFHTRMFAPAMGVHEDPATGSALAAFSAAIHCFDQLPDGHHSYLVEQGVEMGRPSYLHLHLDIGNGEIVGARIGGQAVKIAAGELYL